MTSDLTNALAASAENLNSLYVQSTNSLINNPNPHMQFENLVYQCAIHFGECIFYKIKCDGSKEGKKIEGIWEGKNISEWSNNIVRCYDI